MGHLQAGRHAAKALDVSSLRAAGWEAKVGLREGIASTVDWYRSHVDDLREAG